MSEERTVAKRKRANASKSTSRKTPSTIDNLPPGVTLFRTLKGHRTSVRSVVFDPKGQWLASGSSDRTVKLWEMSSGELIHTLEGRNDGVQSVAFGLRGRLASGSSDHTVKLWNIDGCKLVHTLHGHRGEIGNVVFDPQSERLASASADGTVRLWAVSSGKLLRTLEGHQHFVPCVAFDPLGQWIASGS